MRSTFIAQYGGQCDECGGQVKGQEVMYDQYGELVHVVCPETGIEKPKNTPLCPRCFCYHNGDCA